MSDEKKASSNKLFHPSDDHLQKLASFHHYLKLFKASMRVDPLIAMGHSNEFRKVS